MAYTKTGITISGGASPVTIEEDGWVPSISATGLEEDVSYTVTAYVVANGQTFASPSSSFRTLQSGKVVIDGLSYEYNREGGCYIINWKYTSIYPVDDEAIRCYWSDDPNMRDSTTYIPNVTPNTVNDGVCDVKIPAEEGTYYLSISIPDMYGYKCDSTPHTIT